MIVPLLMRCLLVIHNWIIVRLKFSFETWVSPVLWHFGLCLEPQTGMSSCFCQTRTAEISFSPIVLSCSAFSLSLWGLPLVPYKEWITLTTWTVHIPCFNWVHDLLLSRYLLLVSYRKTQSYSVLSLWSPILDLNAPPLTPSPGGIQTPHFLQSKRSSISLKMTSLSFREMRRHALFLGNYI